MTTRFAPLNFSISLLLLKNLEETRKQLLVWLVYNVHIRMDQLVMFWGVGKILSVRSKVFSYKFFSTALLRKTLVKADLENLLKNCLITIIRKEFFNRV